MYSGEKDFHYNVKGSFTMRKLVSLGLFALSLGVISPAVLAGNQDDLCGFLKEKEGEYYVPGLYGLCTAFQNETDELARLDILDAFYAKAPDGLDMPGYDPLPDSEPVPVPVTCPCWEFDALFDELACTSPTFEQSGGVVDSNPSDTSGWDSVRFNNGATDLQFWAGYTPLTVNGSTLECIVVENGTYYPTATTPEEDGVCRMNVLELMAGLPLPEEIQATYCSQ